MILCSIAKNLFQPWKQERWQEAHRAGGTVGDYLPSDMLGEFDVISFRNSARCELDDLVGSNDSLTFVVRPHAAALAAGGFKGFLANFLLSAALSFALQKLFPPSRISGPQQRNDEDSPTYSFRGISNNRSEGQPILIVYGEMRVGGTVIGEYVSTVSLYPPRTDLNILFCFGEGPIESIGGVEVDNSPFESLGSPGGGDLPRGIKVAGNLAENYEGIEAQVRMGTQEQNVIPAFEDARQSFDVGQKLTSTEVTIVGTGEYAIEVSGTDPFTDVNDAFWDEHAASFDLNIDDVDSMIVRIRFPGGYFRQDLDTGGLAAAWFGMQVRYRRLTSGGVQITTGGTFGDGWVRLPVVNIMPFSKRGPFEWEFQHTFRDKDNYSDPVVGKCNLHGGGGRTGFPHTGYPYSDGAAVDGFSFSTWVMPRDDSLATAALGTWWHIAGDFRASSGNDKGWSVGFVRKHFSNNGNSLFRWQWAIEYGTGGSRNVLSPPSFFNSSPSFTPQENQWHHLFVVYKSENNGPGSDANWQLYVNGQLAFNLNRPDNQKLRAPGSTRNHIRIANNPFGTEFGRFENFFLDDVHMWSDKLSASRVAHLYNGGQGTSALIRADILVVNYNWDDPTTGPINNAAPLVGGQWYGDADPEVGTDVGNLTGHVAANSSGAFLRGQFHVEVIRANVESTNAAVTNVANFDIITSIEDSALSYPNLALAALRIPATDQLSSTVPTCTFLLRGRPVPTWDGLSETNPAIPPIWSQNPAWIALDILINKRYGMGQFYDVRDVVLPDLLSWAQYSDETVYDGGLQLVMSAGEDDVRFVNSTVDADTAEVRGSLEFTILQSNFPGEAPPVSWQVGTKLYLTGFPSAGTGIFNDINNDTGAPDDFPGYEIFEITNIGGKWLIKAFWDRLDETFPDPWATGTSLEADVLPADALNWTDFTAIMAGGQARFSFNGVYDAHRSAWDALLEVCTVGRAMPIREGSRIRFKFNSARDPVGVIGLGSIIEDTFEISYSGLPHKPNVVEITILDEDREFESVTVEARADELNPTNVGNVRKASQTLFGVTNRHQAERHARFQVLVNERLKRTATWEMGPNGLEYEPGDVVRIAHDILPRGASGRVFSTNAGGVKDRFVIDRSLTIEVATTYRVYIQGALDDLSIGTVDTAITVPADYERGDTIFIDSLDLLEFGPRQDDIWILVADTKELLMEITSVSLNADMSKEIEALEFDATIYEDENDFPDSEQSSTNGPDNPINDQGNNAGGFTTETSLPLHVRQVDLSDRFTRTGPGQFILVVHASWEVEPADRFYIDHTEIYVREIDDQVVAQIIGITGEVGVDEASVPTDDRGRRSSPWRQVASVGGYDEFAEFPIPQALIGREIDVAVCPVKLNGVKRTATSCTYGTHTVSGFGPHPPALTSLSAQLRAQLVTYAWELAAGEQDAIVELRRTSFEDETKAGWILAPVVFKGSMDDSETPPMHDWAGSTILGKARILSRTINSIGHKSDLFVRAFNPSPVLDSFPTSVDNADQHWSTFDTNTWIRAIPQAGDPSLSNLQEVNTDPDNYLEFEGTNLAGNYTSQHDSTFTLDLDNFRAPREYYVEAVLVAEQRHPLVLNGDAELGDPAFARWTLEGPTHLRPGEANCTLELQARFNINGTQSGWGNYQTFRPGLYTFVQIQYRIKVTRPDTTYQVRIHKFETRVTSPARGIVTRTPYDAALEREFMN